MSLFRCRRCDLKVTDPLEHIEFAHGIPSTMAQVWESFALVASSHGKGRAVKDDTPELTEPLPF